MVYKIYFALLWEKIIYNNSYYILTVNIKTKIFTVWYLDNKIPKELESCKHFIEAEFKWKILLNQKGVSQNENS